MDVTESNFISACYGRNEGRLPVWIMRQAGRYLPEYRAVRERATFQELCRSPQLIAEVVRQPIERFGFDAAILFSDILTVLEPMGAEVTFPSGGPQIKNPIKSPEDVSRLKDVDAEEALPFVLEGIRRIKQVLPQVPLIGFAGSPFTLACYLIEGKGSKNFDAPKRFLHEHPRAAEQLLELLSDVIGRYLQAQIDAGVEAVQIFESWGGILCGDDFADWSARLVNRIFASLKSSQVPRIFFVNNVSPYLDALKDIDCEVIGVDYRVDMNQVARALPGKSVQGNLDPAVLFGTPEHVVERATRILDSMDNLDSVIFNLGHGIQPKTPLESVQALVETVHSYRRQSCRTA